MDLARPESERLADRWDMRPEFEEVLEDRRLSFGAGGGASKKNADMLHQQFEEKTNGWLIYTARYKPFKSFAHAASLLGPMLRHLCGGVWRRHSNLCRKPTSESLTLSRLDMELPNWAKWVL